VAGAGAAVHFSVFWACVLLLACALVFVIAGLPYIDLGWRFRCGVVLAVTAVGAICLWPSIAALSGGKVPCPQWIREGVSFRLVAGLDLRGGLRLTYNVEVDEAIRDTRNARYEEMRAELARLFGFHSGDGVPSEEAYARLRSKIEIEAPRQTSDVINVVVKERADIDRIDARFLERFRGDLSYRHPPDSNLYEFRVRSQLRSEIRGTG
jgi:preprotein translocase subunit SecD